MSLSSSIRMMNSRWCQLVNFDYRKVEYFAEKFEQADWITTEKAISLMRLACAIKKDAKFNWSPAIGMTACLKQFIPVRYQSKLVMSGCAETSVVGPVIWLRKHSVRRIQPWLVWMGWFQGLDRHLSEMTRSCCELTSMAMGLKVIEQEEVVREGWAMSVADMTNDKLGALSNPLLL